MDNNQLQEQIFAMQQKIVSMSEQITALKIDHKQLNDSLAVTIQLVIDHSNVLATIDLRAYLKDAADENIIDFCNALNDKRKGTIDV